MRAPALPLCLAFIAGILLPAAATPFYALALALLALVTATRERWATPLVAVAFVALGNAAVTLHERTVDRSQLRSAYERLGGDTFSSPRLVQGELRRGPETRSDVTILIVDVETIVVRRRELAAGGGLRVSVRGSRRARLESLGAGDRVRLWAAVREPSGFHNPGSERGARRLEIQHIDLLGSVKSGLLVERVRAASPPIGWVSHLRRRVFARLSREIDPPERGVVTALVTGDRTDLSPALIRLYQRAGIFHVMAISGAHVGIWIAFLYAALRWLGASTRRTLLCLLVVLPLYAVFCGHRAPVVRAVMMAELWIGARLFSVRAPAANALAMAALSLLAWEPASLFDAGFQLTMGAMATIALLYERLAARFAPLGLLAKPLAVSVAAQLGVMPIAAWHFHRLTLVSPLASLVAIPVAAAVCVLGVVLVVVSGMGWVATLVSAVTGFAVAVLTSVAEIAASLPAASIRVGAPSLVFLASYAAALMALTSTARRARAAGVLVSCVLLAVTLVPRRPHTGILEIDALDVGHGDALVLTLPEGGHVLIDGGGLPFGSFDVGEAVVLPYLLDRGVRRLDAVVATHGDFDHIGGLATIVSELAVDEIWQGRPDPNRPSYRILLERARERGVPVRTLAPGEHFDLGGARFQVLAAGAAERSNNRSVVFRVSYAGRSVLFTGDAEVELERHLVRSGVDLHADVLKLAHHGSKSSTSAAFLDAVDPDIAIVSARQNRARPIPSEVVLERLRSRGIEYARTDTSGMVTVRVHRDGSLELSTYR